VSWEKEFADFHIGDGPSQNYVPQPRVGLETDAHPFGPNARPTRFLTGHRRNGGIGR
jgi:hypothetical protein